MKKKMKKLTLAKETVRELDKRDGLRHVAGGLYFQARKGTVETGCDFCETGTCSTCYC